MKFDIKYTKLGNKFFFISNLSEWNIYCRKHYNQIWLKNNSLLKKEKNALLAIKEILNRHNATNLFLSSSDIKKIWESVREKIGENDFKKLQGIFELFTSRFEKIWQKEKNNLRGVSKLLKKDLFFSRKIFNLISFLYKIRKKPKKITIILLANPVKKLLIGGGSGLGENKISIECSRITAKNNKTQLLERVIIHELIHASFEKNVKNDIEKYINSEYFRNKYQKELQKSRIYKQTNSFLGVIKELILTSLIPEGYLAEKFFKIDVLKELKKRKSIREGKLQKNYYDLMLYGVFKLYPLSKIYSENKRPIDRKYIESVVDCWIEFEKINLKKFFL